MRVKYLVYSPNFVEKIVKGKKKKLMDMLS